MFPSRNLSILNAHPRLRFDKAAVASVVHTLDQHRGKFLGGCPDGELSLAFLTDTKLAKLHADFLDDPTTTDVITFEGAPLMGVAGEICVSADTAETYARKHARDFSEELTLYVVHGWLHLAGYDDLQPAKKQKMRAAEARALKLLHAAGPLPVFTFKKAVAAKKKRPAPARKR